MPETPQISNQLSGLAARLWMALMGLVLTAAGSFFCWWLFATWQKAARMDSWISTPAVILSSEVVPWRYSDYSMVEYQPRIRYRYEAAGMARESEHIRRVAIRSSQESSAREWVEKFPAGALITAWVDPKNPEMSVLKKDSKAALYSIWFPALFVAGGLSMLWSSVFGRQLPRAA
jgi:hypothetical protein